MLHYARSATITAELRTWLGQFAGAHDAPYYTGAGGCQAPSGAGGGGGAWWWWQAAAAMRAGAVVTAVA